MASHIWERQKTSPIQPMLGADMNSCKKGLKRVSSVHRNSSDIDVPWWNEKSRILMLRWSASSERFSYNSISLFYADIMPRLLWDLCRLCYAHFTMSSCHVVSRVHFTRFFRLRAAAPLEYSWHWFHFCIDCCCQKIFRQSGIDGPLQSPFIVCSHSELCKFCVTLADRLCTVD